MARLINPGDGDYLDRLTILALKVLHGELDGRDVAHFTTERTAILAKLQPKGGPQLLAMQELGAVNAALWYAEDHLREYRQIPDPTPGNVMALAFRIQELNDRRAALIARINEQSGTARGTEKL